MSVGELIDQLKRLPPHEQAEFARCFRKLQKEKNKAQQEQTARAPEQTWPDFTARLRQIYGDRVVAESDAVLDYARGER